MKRYVYSMGAVMLLGCCMPALAQGYYGNPPPGPDHDVAKGYFAGGYTVAKGEAANFVDNGWNVGGGVYWRLPSGPVSLRLDFAYSRNNATNQLLSEGAAANRTHIDHGWSDLFSNDFDVIFNIPLARSVNAYVMGGGGGAIRRISLTQTVTSGGPYCNDWAGFCTPGAHPGDVLVDSKTTGRWEWNAGVGLSFSLGGGDALFVEARYMEVETPVPTRFVPIRVGLLL
jgi:Outer membrane protein beta-barrel domain